MTTYKKCKKCGKDFPFEGSFRKSKKIRYLCIDCINELASKDDDEIEEYQSNYSDNANMNSIDWNDPKVIIITIIVIVIVFAFFISIKRDYFPNNYPESRPIDATY